MTAESRPAGTPSPSTKPRSASSASSRSATTAEFPALSETAVPGRSARSAISQPGSRYSAIVMLAAIRSRESRRPRSACAPASNASAASTTRRAQSVTRTPSAVSREPRGERSTRATPRRRSIERIRLLAAGWVMPRSRAARPRLPCRATASSSSIAPRSGTRWARGPVSSGPLTAHKPSLCAHSPSRRGGGLRAVRSWIHGHPRATAPPHPAPRRRRPAPSRPAPPRPELVRRGDGHRDHRNAGAGLPFHVPGLR